MLEYIRKRDGKTEAFRPTKIACTISKATLACKSNDSVIAEQLAERVVQLAEQTFFNTIPRVEDIQDLVEKVLIENGQVRTADYLDAPIPPGERNGRLFKAAAAARENGADDLELRTLAEKAHLVDGLPMPEAIATVRSAARRHVQPRRQWEPPRRRRRMALPTLTATPMPETNKGPANNQLAAFMEALFGSDDSVNIMTAFAQDGERYRPSGKGTTRTVEDVLTAGVKGHRAGGALVRICPVKPDTAGCTDADVARYAHCLLESDTIPLDTQWRIVTALRVPCSTVVHSGNKSLHFAVRIDAGEDRDLYDERVAFLYSTLDTFGFKPDRANRNPSRMTRLPGVPRGDGRQWLVARNVGCEDWESWVDFVEKSEGLPEPVSAAIMAANPPPIDRELVHGILRRGHKLLIAGSSKAFKSWRVIRQAAALSAGAEWLGYRCERGKVFFCNLEIAPGSFWRRLKAVSDVTPVELDNIAVWNLRGHRFTLDEFADRLIEHARGYDAIIIDPIYKLFAAADENSATDIGEVLAVIKQIARETGAAVCTAHHFAKGMAGARDAIDRPSGRPRNDAGVAAYAEGNFRNEIAPGVLERAQVNGVDIVEQCRAESAG